MIDRIVQYPHRYKAIPVAGQENVFDFVPVPGTITADGTPLNKGVLLSDETARSLCLTDETATINTALRRTNLSSFMTFCGADLDAALGKGNESRLFGIGRQLAMYAWFMGETAAFSTLIKCDTLQECYQQAITEILNSPAIVAMLNGSTYATENMYTEDNIAAWKRSFAVMSDLVKVPSVVDKIRTNYWDAWKGGWQTYTARGDVSFIVPEGVTCLTVEAVGAGENGRAYSTTSGAPSEGGAGGAYRLSVMRVVPGQIITGSISTDGTVFGDISLGKGGGASGGGGGGQSAAVGITPPQSGKFLKVSAGGGISTSYYRASGGGGGYGGGNGGYGGYNGTSQSSIAARASGGTGASVLPITAGTGGTAGTNGSSSSSGAPAAGSGGGGGGAGNGRMGDNIYFGGGGGGGYGGGGGGYRTNSSTYPTSPGGGGSGCIVIYM